MQMLYNSDSFAVVQFDVPGTTEGMVAPAPHEPLTRGGYEIVDKFARKEIFIQGALAERFKADVQALIENDPSEEDLDAYIGRFAALMLQPLVLH
jgi:hypothetical protein